MKISNNTNSKIIIQAGTRGSVEPEIEMEIESGKSLEVADKTLDFPIVSINKEG